jgi:hypothetical protein
MAAVILGESTKTYPNLSAELWFFNSLDLPVPIAVFTTSAARFPERV